MDLTHEQKDAVRGWAAEGAGLSEIQSRLKDVYGIQLSYMDTRFLVIDLEAEIKDPPSKAEPPKKAESTDTSDRDAGDDAEAESVETEALPADGGVTVDISPITRPGFAVAGTVVFSDGVKAEWGVTVDGRLSLDPEKDGYRPTPEDIRAFQSKLRELFASQGMA